MRPLKALLLSLVLVMASAVPSGLALAQSAAISQEPLFLTQSVEPLVMLNLSRDHQLYLKAYDDYSDITGDGIPDTTYQHDFEYYGYFDPYKCYTYTFSRFNPTYVTNDRYCNGSTWSGNFLNWATMTRIDVIRRVLYGGYRRSDTTSVTELERTYLPGDAHSFPKFYDGADLNSLTPYSSATGITMCNTTVAPTSEVSENVTSPPIFRVVNGNYSLWAAGERWQCRYSGERWDGNNGNNPAVTGYPASGSPPPSSAIVGTFRVRVRVCVEGLHGTENCKYYPQAGTVAKPIGLLQTYGDDNLIRFGLITGSYSRNTRGGMLRRNIGSMNSEVNTQTGQFISNPAGGGIINTLNILRIHGYEHNQGYYNSHDNCSWGLSQFSEGNCSNWGNPQAEILLESLRYFANVGSTATFQGNDTNYIAGLTSATWQDPVPANRWCAPLNVIQFDASTISYDASQLGGATTLGMDLEAMTDAVGEGEGIHGNEYFVGETDDDDNQLCTAKTVNSLSEVRGVCPDGPRLQGSYHMAGLAYWANTSDIRADRDNDQRVVFTGVSMSPSRPGVDVPVPGDPDSRVVILPACRNNSTSPDDGNCAIVDFKIVSQDLAAGTGRMLVNWEDSEQGGDFDQDMWGLIDYEIDGSQLHVTTDVIAQSTPNEMGFGYILSGTTQDGFHVHSGINGFDYNDPTGADDCNNCTVGNGPNTNTYTLGGSSASLLRPPLWYAARWGSFNDINGNNIPDLPEEWDPDGDGHPDNYHEVTNPANLVTALDDAFLGAIRTRASAASVATNSTRLDVDTVIYQARFDSEDWRGEMLAFEIEPDGSIGDLKWNAGDLIPEHSSRNIFTSRPGVSPFGAEFQWANLTAAQQLALNTNLPGSNDGLGELRVAYLRGDTAQERRFGGTFRNRLVTVLGDVVNSDPFYVGRTDYGYSSLPDATESAAYVTFRSSAAYQQRAEMLYFGANDGMLHAIDADTGDEMFAYVPAATYPYLSWLTHRDYQHRYYVDGSPRAGDVYINSAWATVLIGSTGAGGRTFFALDITDPDNFGATDVMWEFSHAELGVALAQPAIIRLADGNWYAAIGNGPESASGRAQLILINIATGAAMFLDTGSGSAGSPNGLMSAVPVDINGDRITDTIYAGDLRGNMWKFDVTGANTNQWDVAYKQGVTRYPLFTATDADGDYQPITHRPAVGIHPDGGVMVYFGTGEFYAVGDNIVGGNPQIQTFYGVRDSGSRVQNSRAALQEQELIAELELLGSDLRLVTENEVDYSSDHGWYLDLESPVNGPEGERVVANPLLRHGRIIFTTLIPSSEPCDFGGTGWLMELEAVNGARLHYSVFDLNEDELFDENDFVEIEIDGETVQVPVSGLRSEVGIIKTPGIIAAGDREYKYTSGSTGEIGVTTEAGGDAGGRQSWRQLR